VGAKDFNPSVYGTLPIDRAAAEGDLYKVKRMHKKNEGCTKAAMDSAATNGHFEIVKFLHENRTEGCSTDAMDFAAMNGHSEIVKFLAENRTEGCLDAMDLATENGHLNLAEWLYEQQMF